MNSTKVWLCIGGSALLTYLLRLLPLEFLAKRELPRPLVIWLSFVPAGVITAIFCQWLLVPAAGAGLSGDQQMFLAVSLPAFAIAYKTRNFLTTLVVGCLLTALGRWALLATGLA